MVGFNSGAIMDGDNRIKGVLAPVLTPFNNDLQPDKSRFVAFCRALLSLDIGLAPFGSTGEGNSLSVAEKIQLLDALAESGVDMKRVMPGTGHCSITDTLALTRHVISLGCAGALVLPPFYYKNISDDAVYRSYSEIIQRIADSRLRLYLYHFPRQSQIPLSFPVIERLLNDYPLTIAGLKDSSGDFSHMEALRRTFPMLDLFSGSEALMLSVLKIGGAGVISANANVNGAAMVELYRIWRTSEAQGFQDALLAFRSAFSQTPMIPGLKALIAIASGDSQWRNTRPPLLDLDLDQEDAMVRSLAKAGFAL